MKDLLKNAYNLPWKFDDAPHAVLDIIRGCNIKCNACYNSDKFKVKTLNEVIEDYKKITKLRKISTVTILGGEPLLNPDLINIIKFLKNENLSVSLFTNGLLLDEERTEKLALAGVNLVFLHIQKDQQRQDLHPNHTIADINALRTQKAKMLYKAGIEAGMSVTVRKSDLEENFDNDINYFKQTIYMTDFVITLFRNTAEYGRYSSFSNEELQKGHYKQKCSDEPEMQEILEFFQDRNLELYTYLTGRYDKNSPRWICYHFAASYKNNELKFIQNIRNSKFERFYLKRLKEKTGAYPFYTKQNCIINSIYMFLNSLSGGYFSGNQKFLIKSWNKYKRIKRILVQEPAGINSAGILDYCESCPDITVKNGKIVPLCICDNFE